MKFPIILSISTFISVALGKACSSEVYRDECVIYFSDGNCNDQLGDYVPTCKGNCFQYVFVPFLLLQGCLCVNLSRECCVGAEWLICDGIDIAVLIVLE